MGSIILKPFLDTRGSGEPTDDEFVDAINKFKYSSIALIILSYFVETYRFSLLWKRSLMIVNNPPNPQITSRRELELKRIKRWHTISDFTHILGLYCLYFGPFWLFIPFAFYVGFPIYYTHYDQEFFHPWDHHWFDADTIKKGLLCAKGFVVFVLSIYWLLWTIMLWSSVSELHFQRMNDYWPKMFFTWIAVGSVVFCYSLEVIFLGEARLKALIGMATSFDTFIKSIFH